MQRSQNVFSAFWVSIRIFWEFFTGFLFIRKYEKSVSFFGSARETLPEKYYEDCEELASRFSNKGFVVITGGGEGIMGAANKGAARVNKESIGINIKLPHEQKDNNFLTSKKTFNFFFSRKIVLSCASEVYVFFPGGFGTLDELFEMLTLIQTHHSVHVPIILYGKDYWEPILKFLEGINKHYKTIDQEDTEIYRLFDSIDEIDAYVDTLELDNRICAVGAQRVTKI